MSISRIESPCISRSYALETSLLMIASARLVDLTLSLVYISSFISWEQIIKDLGLFLRGLLSTITIKIFNITIRYAGKQEVINDDQICICQMPQELDIFPSGLRYAESFEQFRHFKIAKFNKIWSSVRFLYTISRKLPLEAIKMDANYESSRSDS